MSGSDTKLVIAFDARIGNLESQLKKVSAELKKTGDQGKRTQQDLGGLGGSFSRIATAASAALGPLSGLLATVGVGLGIGAAVSGFMRLADAVGNLGEQADQVGVSIESLQAWQALGVQFNVTSEGMATALTRFTRTLGEAAEGNEEAAAKFVRLGVSIRDSSGNLREPEAVLGDVARAISEIDNPAQRAANAVGLLGRAGQQLLPILVDVGTNQRDVVTAARDMGAVISAETSASFDKFGDSLAEFGRRVYVFIANVLEPLARGIGNVFEAMNRTLALGAQAARIRAGEGTAGDLERAQEILERQREAETRAREDLERRRTRGQFTRRELEPDQRRVEAAAAETARLEAEVTRIQALAQAQRTQQEADAGRARRDVLQRTQAEIEGDERRAVERAAAARRGAAALRDFEQREAARQATDRRVADLARQGVTVTDTERTGIFDRQLAIARNNAVQAPSGGGARSVSDEVRKLNEELRQADQVLSRLDTQTRTPLESFRAGLGDVTTAIERVTTTTGNMSDETRRNLADARDALAGVGFEQFARSAETGAERAAKAMREAGASVEDIQRSVNAAVEAYIADLRRLGRISDEEIQLLRDRVQRGIQRGVGDDGFFGGLRSGLGLDPKGKEISFGETVGLGIGRETLRAFDTLFDLLNQVADGSKTAGDALKEFAAAFVQSVAKIIAQAALLAAVQAIFSYFFPGGPSAGVGGASTGVSGRMSGGAVAGGYTYLVGERGPELFTAPSAGRIISNGAFGGGGVSFVVNNNAPGVVVQQEQIDERTLVASVNMARTEVQRDYQRSMRTGYGPYSETLARTHGVRRRV